MKSLKKLLTALFLVTAFTTLKPATAFAGGDDNKNNNPNNCASVPVNSGIVYLVVAGLVIGFITLNKKNKLVSNN